MAEPAMDKPVNLPRGDGRQQADAVPGAQDEALWYKDAVIYQLHVKAFFDTNDDGIGDFAGLIEKLDYLQDLGVNAHVAAAVLSLAAAATTATTSPTIATCTRIRHAAGLPRASCARRSGAGCASSPNWSSTTPPTSTPGSSARAARRRDRRKRDLYVWSDTDQKYDRHAHHLHRHREVELDLGPGRQGVLLAPLLLPPAGPEFRQSAGAAGGDPRDALLARHGRRRLPARRHSLSVRARGHQQREPARDPRRHQARSARSSTRITRTGCCWPRPTSGPRTCANISATATNATWPTISR